MPTDYTPDGETEHAPAPAPSFDEPAIVRLPVSTDPFATTAYYQALKALAEQGEFHRQELRWQRGLVFLDDFVASPRADVWTTTTGTWSASLLTTGRYDIANGEAIQSADIGITSLHDFRVRFRGVGNSIDGTSVTRLGLISGSKSLAFQSDGTTAWEPLIDLALDTPAAVVAPSTGPLSQEFEIRRVDGQLTMLVDGTVIYSAAHTDSFGGPIVIDHANTGAFFLDRVELSQVLVT